MGDDKGPPPLPSKPSPFARLGRALAYLLQLLVLGIERLIELLGQEPERRWENVVLRLPGYGLPGGAATAALMLKRARALVERGESESALRLYVKVLELEPDNAAVMATAAELLAELGDGDAAKVLLLKAIALDPAHGADKYALLGHLEQGGRAIAAFERALELLAAQTAGLGRVDGDVKLAATRRDIAKRTASLMAAQAKVYLTDCFLERDSLKSCERLLDGALLHDPGCAEATQALADLRLSQGHRGTALLLVLRTLELCAANAGAAGGRGGTAATYDFRTVTSRLLVELGQYEPAASLLEELTAEDGEDTEVWYLLGLCCMLLGRPTRSRQALGAARALLLQSQCGDDGLLGQIDALLERTSITETDKAEFWNPRWWMGKTEALSTVPSGAASAADMADAASLALSLTTQSHGASASTKGGGDLAAGPPTDETLVPMEMRAPPRMGLPV